MLRICCPTGPDHLAAGEPDSGDAPGTQGLANGHGAPEAPEPELPEGSMWEPMPEEPGPPEEPAEADLREALASGRASSPSSLSARCVTPLSDRHHGIVPACGNVAGLNMCQIQDCAATMVLVREDGRTTAAHPMIAILLVWRRIQPLDQPLVHHVDRCSSAGSGQ